jgi:hypothetical protein
MRHILYTAFAHHHHQQNLLRDSANMSVEGWEQPKLSEAAMWRCPLAPHFPAPAMP